MGGTFSKRCPFLTESLFPFPPEGVKCAHESTHIYRNIRRSNPRIRRQASLGSGHRTSHWPRRRAAV